MAEPNNNIKDFAEITVSILGLIFSIFALVVSTRVSKRQDRISMFEKKYDVYKTLKSYFESTKGWPKTISRFLYPNINLQTDNVWSPEINEIVESGTLLFSKAVAEKLKIIKKMYADIRHLDINLDSYFTSLSDQPNYSIIKSKLVEYLQDYTTTEQQEKEFAEFCRNTRITVNEPVDQDQYELVTYDFYELHKKQSKLELEISKMQKSILEAILSEIKPLK